MIEPDKYAAETFTAVSQAREVMDSFMAAFDAKDALAMQQRWFHFPHVRFHSGGVTIMERPEDFHSPVGSERRSRGVGA